MPALLLKKTIPNISFRILILIKMIAGNTVAFDFTLARMLQYINLFIAPGFFKLTYILQNKIKRGIYNESRGII